MINNKQPFATKRVKNGKNTGEKNSKVRTLVAKLLSFFCRGAE
jgi:hypothetical protein